MYMHVSKLILWSSSWGLGVSDFIGQVMLTNPVLESFGNAMTVRNSERDKWGQH